MIFDESNDGKPVTYSTFCVAIARGIARTLQDLEAKCERAVKNGDCPYDLPPDSSVGEMMVGAVLLMFCGMLAQESQYGNKMLLAAERMAADGTLPMSEEIREYAEAVLNTLGVKRTRHNWN
jgi:hypothetical protein